MQGHHHSLCAKWEEPNQARRGPWSKHHLNPSFLQNPEAGARQKTGRSNCAPHAAGLLPVRKATGAVCVKSGVREKETRVGVRGHCAMWSVRSHVRRPITDTAPGPNQHLTSEKTPKEPPGPSGNLLPRLPVSFPFLLCFRLFLKLEQISKTSRV